MDDVKASFTYEERQALAVLRKAMKRKPHIAAALMEGMSKEVAVSVLLQAKTEMAALMEVSHAFTTAAGVLAKELEK
jgi:hypothetical protein